MFPVSDWTGCIHNLWPVSNEINAVSHQRSAPSPSALSSEKSVLEEVKTSVKNMRMIKKLSVLHLSSHLIDKNPHHLRVLECRLVLPLFSPSSSPSRTLILWARALCAVQLHATGLAGSVRCRGGGLTLLRGPVRPKAMSVFVSALMDLCWSLTERIQRAIRKYTIIVIA